MSMQMDQFEQAAPEPSPRERRRNRWVWLGSVVAVLLVVAGSIGWLVYRSKEPPALDLPAGVIDMGGQAAGIVAADEGGSVPVEIYLDFLCPACKQLMADNTLLLNQLLGQRKIKLIWHPVALLNAQSSPPGYSLRAASAAACAAGASMNKMKALGEALFTIQPPAGSYGYNDDQMVEIAGTVGINTPAFAQCVRAQRYVNWVNNITTKAQQRGVSQAPAVYVAGKPLTQFTPEALLTAVATA